MRVLASFLAILMAMLFLTACSGNNSSSAAAPTKAAGTESQSQAGKPTESAKPTTATGSSAGSVSFNDVPVYPGATTEGSFNFSNLGTEVSQDYQKVEWRAYTTNDNVDKVVQYYKSELAKPQYGWTQEGWFEQAGEGGMGSYVKNNGDRSVGLIIGKDEDTGGTSIVLAVGEGKKN